LTEQAVGIRSDYSFDARATMRSALIDLLAPFAAKIAAQ
jgi:hypothetical protein